MQFSSPVDEHDRESDKEYRQCEIEREFSSLPAFKRIFISDRNRYLTYSLKKAAEPTPAGQWSRSIKLCRIGRCTVKYEHNKGLFLSCQYFNFFYVFLLISVVFIHPHDYLVTVCFIICTINVT